MAFYNKVIFNYAALKHNLQQVQNLAPRSSILAMIKSNAYGHGLEDSALALQNADAFGVISLEEGIRLRQIGLKHPIFLMQGISTSQDLLHAAAHNFTLVLHDLCQLEIIQKQKILYPLSIWIKVDNEMNHLGFKLKEVVSVYQQLHQCKYVKKPIGLMTHLSQADKEFISHHLKEFDAATKNLPGPRSFANSATIIEHPELHADMVRPGVMLYGASPFRGRIGKEFSLNPVMTLCSFLIAIRDIQKGERIGYDGALISDIKRRIGVVGIGYGDGYPHHAKTGTPVLVGNTICPLLGHVSMNTLVVDLTLHPAAKIGDAAILWGEGLPVEYVAEQCNTNAELFTRLSRDLKVEL